MKKFELYIFFAALLYRFFLFFMERSVGIGVWFHPDSVYYVESARNLLSLGFIPKTLFYSENIGYVIFVAGILKFTDSVSLVIFINMLLGAYLVVLVARAQQEIMGDSFGHLNKFAIIYVAFGPYIAHLSVHILKDIPFLVAAISLLRSANNKNYVFFAWWALVVILIRYNLGVFIIMLCGVLFVLKKKPKFWWIIWGVWFVFIFVFFDILMERRDVIFEGREFFGNVTLVSNFSGKLSVVFLSIFGGFVNLIIPNILQVRSASEAIFGLDSLFYQVLLFVSALKIYRNWWSFSRFQKRTFFLIFSLGLIVGAFCIITTPAVGPLVRYRLFSLVVVILVAAAYVRPISRNTKQKLLSNVR